MNILLVEPDDGLSSVLSVVIEEKSKKVIVASSIEEMFHYLEHFQFDIIIVELILIDGFVNELFNYIRQFDEKPRIIFITHTDKEPIHSVKMLKKPFSLEEFEQVIDIPR